MTYQPYANEIKHRLSMMDIAERYGITTDGRSRKALCPFHSDTRPSMWIYSGDRGYYCYACNTGGDIIDFVMRYFNLSFSDACKKINDDFNLRLPIKEKLDYEKRKKAQAEYERFQAEKEAVERKRKLLFMIYYAAYNRYAYLDQMRTQEQPTSPDSPVSKRYIYACKHIDEAWNEVEEASENLRKFEEQHGRKHGEYDD